MNLENKKILFIAPRYFGYDKEIKKEMERQGADVHFFNDKNIFLNTICKYLTKDLKLYNFVYRIISAFLPKQINYIFIIDGFSMSVKTLEMFKNKYKNSKYILYLWDGVRNCRNSIKISNYFDKVLTFDIEDSKKYNWYYRPLFYSRLKADSVEKDIDVLYVCSLHSKRMKTLNEISKYCFNNNLNLYTYLYISLPILIYYKYIKHNKDYIFANINNVKLKKISLNEMYDLYNRSKSVIDFTHPNQSGYTMRTIECLGYNCKLFTNNKNITKADFYNRNNIAVYDDINKSLNNDFITRNYDKCSKDILQKYSLSGWIEEIFE